MKKETIEIKAAYVAPEVKAFEVRTENALLQTSYGLANEPGDEMTGEEGLIF